MSSRQMLRLSKWVTIGGLAGVTLGGSVGYLQQHKWDITSTGLVRFGRAAAAAVIVAVDYKKTLNDLDQNAHDYAVIKSQLHRRSAERLRAMCCANGGCFIKVGQHVGALEYLLPKEYTETMRVLHSGAPHSQVTELYTVLKEDLGKDVDEIFSSFDKKPLGAASLAQVHKATLEDGTVVAVKIQHPNVKRHSFVDMKTMEFLIRGVAWLFPEFRFMWLAEETKKNLPKELDFIHEGRNCERVAKMLSPFRFLKVPKVYWDLSSERVLTMEYCEGGQVNDKKYIEKHNISVNEVVHKLGQLYSEMIFVQGYVHCDPHPGNVLVNKTSEGTTLVLLDHGLYTSLADEFRLNYCNLWSSLINADLAGIKQYSTALHVGHMYGLFACMVTGRSWTAVTSGIDKQSVTEEEDDEIKSNAANYLAEISTILNTVPREMLLIFKTNDLLRGIESNLNVRSHAASFITMSRCCIRAVYSNKQKQCKNWLTHFTLGVSCQIALVKISLYKFFLWLRSTALFQNWLAKTSPASLRVTLPQSTLAVTLDSTVAQEQS